MKRVLTCLGMMSVLLLTFTVSLGFVPNGYHNAYARGDLDPLGTKIRESINNQITEELSGSAGPNPTSGSSPPSSSPSVIGTELTFNIDKFHDLVVLFGQLTKNDSPFGFSLQAMTFTGIDKATGKTVKVDSVVTTDRDGIYATNISIV